MAENLVLVESPAKCKTLQKYLGKNYKILATYGHVRDLLAKTGAVNPDEGFSMRYELIDRNRKHVDEIVKALKTAKTLYLAVDPDREGEAIAWHVFSILQERGALKNKAVHRIAFHSITKDAVQTAIENPRKIDMNLVNAQQARRALDYLVGFNLSPLLWKKIRAGLSAGRVQSPALRMIVEREIAIEAFEPKEYWSVTANCNAKKEKFDARLTQYNGEKVEQFTITEKKQADAAKKNLEKAANGKLIVDKIEKKMRKRNPSPPFITSTLQQEAVRKLGFSAKQTMMLAQQLYEGIDVGAGSVGLITYMRTDSTNLAPEAIAEIRELIATRYNKKDVPAKPRIFKSKSKNAQEAHEAIRPTSVMRKPDDVKKYLNAKQHKLYELIWKRTVASQMIHADINTVSVDLLCGKDHMFRATGSNIVNPGFIKIYQEGLDDASADDVENILPVLKEGDKVDLLDILCAQHFTEPPPRYSEATLVKALEEHGIGRPSTYASIISTLQNRGYAELDQKRFHPTDVGRIVNKFLTEFFEQYVDYDFTAHLEDSLDQIAIGKKVWATVLEKFWKPFKKQVDKIEKSVKRSDVTQEKIDEKCPKCGGQLSIRLGRGGRFIGCNSYPECKYTRSMDGEETSGEPEIIKDHKCPQCGSDLQIRVGRYGKFIGCTNYPKCKHVESLTKPKDTEVKCPECHKGTMLVRKSRYGKLFYSCSRYPDCKYAVWNEPVKKVCPNCKWPILTVKVTKRRGTELVCPQKNCDYVKKVKDKEQE